MKRFFYLIFLILLFTNYCSADLNTKDIGKMITIPAGRFLMGNPGLGPFAPPNTFPQQSIDLQQFQIGKYEVTRGEFRKFIETGNYNKSAYWSFEGWKWKEKQKRTEPRYWAANQDLGFGHFSQTDEHPVTGVSFYEAEAYCKWVGGRLPTEAEWEKAAGWTGVRPVNYPWGNGNDDNKTDNAKTNPTQGGHGYSTYPVGSHTDGASTFGCMDMAGNVYEWCCDWYRYYPGNTVIEDETNKHKVLKGGNWYGGEYGNQVNYRNRTRLGDSWFGSGFRIVKNSINSNSYNTMIGEMITIPAGNFIMGSSENDKLASSDEFTQHSIYLPSYQIGKYEITRGEYRKFIDEGGYSNPSYWSFEGRKWKESINAKEPKNWAADGLMAIGKTMQTDKTPVIGVNYYEAEAYCNWIGGRLPTEAEWEKAARWDEKNSISNIYPWGNIYDSSIAESSKICPRRTGRSFKVYEIGSFTSGASAYGCMDMTGSAYEWCADWYKSYSGAKDLYDGTGLFRVMRGGDNYLQNCVNRCASRKYAAPSYSWYASGFRVAK